MIHLLFVKLSDALKAKGVPYECVYGPTPVGQKVGATRIQVLRDYDANEGTAAPRGRFVNPRNVATRSVPAVVRIFAKSVIAGAQRHDHERLADKIADQVQVELHKAVRASNTTHNVVRAGLVSDDTTDGWAGVVYEIRFAVDRGVADTSWVGDAAGEMTMTATTAQTALNASGPPAGTDLPSATTELET